MASGAEPPSLPLPEQMAHLSRRWSMPVSTVEAWLTIPPRAWATINAKVLHAAGLSAAQGRDLHDRVEPAVRGDIGRLVDAGRMASLDTRDLHLWAAAGLLAPDSQVNRSGRVRVSYTGWVTAARRYIAAAGGNQHLAALAAAAGLSTTETAARHRAGSLDEEGLQTLAALASAAGTSSAMPPA